MRKNRYKGLGASQEEINDRVQALLNQKQEKKEFKDVGTRVSGSKKEKRAYRTISFNDLQELENDSILAQELVVKDKVYPFVDVAAERERGVSAGAAYLKVKLRDACAKKAPNTAIGRASYVKFLSQLSEDIVDVTTVSQMRDLCVRYGQFNKETLFSLFVKPQLSMTSEEINKEMERLRLNTTLSYFNYWVKYPEQIFGKNFCNLLFNRSDASKVNWEVARQYEPLSINASAVLVDLHNKNYGSQIDRFSNALNTLKNAINPYQMKDVFLVVKADSKYKSDVPLAQKTLTPYLQKWLSEAESSLNNVPKHILAHDNDWSWFDGTKDKKETVKSDERQINTGIPLTHIKRTGGLLIPQSIIDNAKNANVEENPIIQVFGFASVQFGNALSDKDAREHIKHFLGAMTDLAEILDIDIREINQLGGLSIAFASRGIGKFLAHYESIAKIINLTNRRGDGSLCHEWGHYLDNILTSMDGKNESIAMASKQEYTLSRTMGKVSNFAENFEVRQVIEEIMSFIKRSDYYKQSSKMSSDYWIKPVELFARAFETYVYDKLKKAGRENNYLVSDKYFAAINLRSGDIIYVYPQNKERDALFALFDELFSTIKYEYEIQGFKAFTNKRKDETIELPKESSNEPEPIFVKQLLGFKRLLEAV